MNVSLSNIGRGVFQTHEFIQTKKFEIQPNSPVKTTYVPNRIEIPTHGGDLGHHRLHMEGGIRNHQ
jgi:hypothetical protein